MSQSEVREWVICKRSTGEIVEGGFKSRGTANQIRWSRYEEGYSGDPQHEAKYSVESLDKATRG